MVALGPRECDVSRAQAIVVLVSAIGSLQCPYRLLVLQWHLQIQWLGTRAGSDGGCGQWCAHRWLQRPAADACVVGGASCNTCVMVRPG